MVAIRRARSLRAPAGSRRCRRRRRRGARASPGARAAARQRLRLGGLRLQHAPSVARRGAAQELGAPIVHDVPADCRRVGEDVAMAGAIERRRVRLALPELPCQVGGQAVRGRPDGRLVADLPPGRAVALGVDAQRLDQELGDGRGREGEQAGDGIPEGAVGRRLRVAAMEAQAEVGPLGVDAAAAGVEERARQRAAAAMVRLRSRCCASRRGGTFKKSGSPRPCRIQASMTRPPRVSAISLQHRADQEVGRPAPTCSTWSLRCTRPAAPAGSGRSRCRARAKR